jgi:hypothetical protein
VFSVCGQVFGAIQRPYPELKGVINKLGLYR